MSQLIFILFNKQTEIHLSSCDLLPAYPQYLRLSQSEARKLKLNSGLPQSRQGSTFLSLHLLPHRACISGHLGSEAEFGLEFRHSDMGCRHSMRQCNAVPNACHYQKAVFLTAFFSTDPECIPLHAKV